MVNSYRMVNQLNSLAVAQACGRFLSFLTVLFWRMRRVGEVFFMEAEDTGSGAT